MQSPYTLGSGLTQPADLTPFATSAAPTFTGTTTFGGPIRIANSTAAAPALAFAGDIDTGLFQTAADSIGLAAGGGTVLRAAATAGQMNNLLANSAPAGGTPTLMAEGADANVSLRLQSKGSTQDLSDIVFMNGASRALARIGGATGTLTNSLLIRAQTTGNPVQLYAEGSDSNIDLALTAKGTSGRVRFGNFTTGSDTPIIGYVEIKDAGGTIRKLAVIA